MTKFIEQKKIFYNIFNKEFTHTFDESCLIDQQSMIMNFNNIIDCKNIFDLFKSNIDNDYKIINKFEKKTIKHIKEYYDNDVETLNYHIDQMINIESTIDNTLLNIFNSNNLQVSIQIFSETVKNEIRKLHEYLKHFEKYLHLTTCSIDLHLIFDKYLSDNKFTIDKFDTNMKYFEKAIIFRDYIQKYYRLINEFYCNRIINETSNVHTNVYSFYNLCVTLENMYPRLKQIYENFSNSFIKIKKNLILVPENCYVPVNSNHQINTYIRLGNYNTQIYPLINLILRFVNIQPYNIKQIFNMKDENGNPSDIIIYNELRNFRKIKDSSSKQFRNHKRAEEVTNFLKKQKSIITSDYHHLDYGGNDGGVASEIANILKLNKEQIYSADLEKWLGNTKNNLYPNITYTLLSENQRLPYNNNSFNSISCLQVLHHVEYIEYYISELYRVLKPGGVLIIKEHDSINENTQMLIDIEHMVHEYVKPDIPNTEILKSYAAFYKSFNELNTLLKNNGFELVNNEYNFDIKINPTRYYFAIYKKISETDYLKLQQQFDTEKKRN